MKQFTRFFIWYLHVLILYIPLQSSPLLSPQRLITANQDSVYAKIAELYLPSLISEAPPKNYPQSADPDCEFSQEELIELGFLMLSEKPSEHHAPILSPIGYQDLEIYLGKPKVTRSLFTKIDGTITIMGKLALVKLLFCPTTNVEALLNRQAIIKELATNTELANDLEQQLILIKKMNQRSWDSGKNFPMKSMNLLINFIF